MTYKELRDHVLDMASEESGDDFEDMVKVAINLVYFELLEETENDIERREFTLTTAANRSQYGLPMYVERVLNFDDPTAKWQLEMISANQFDREEPGNVDTGTANKAYPLGDFGIERQPVVSSVLKLTSSSTADDGANFNCVARGMSSGVLTRESMELDGTNTVTSSTTFDADGMERFVLSTSQSKTFAGTVTVKDANIAATVDAGTTATTTTTLVTDTSGLSSTDDIYNGKTISFYGASSGDLSGTTTTITDYDASDLSFTFEAVSEAPADNATFYIDGWKLMELPPFYGESPTYQWWEFHPIPDGKRDLTVRAIMRKPPLVNDDDWPEIPENYHDLIVEGAAASILPVVGKTSAADRSQRRFDRRLKKFSGKSQKRAGRMRTFENVTTFSNQTPGAPTYPRNIPT
jgi:hypothetical protein